ncbi:protein giant [Atheta coriaria]|uniref:protein giant n=1 Tax=Dalotia coriaria TaxID=877792 RepID=UPI0031F44C74
MAVSEQSHIFSMQHLLTPLNCSASSRIIPDVLDLSRKRGRSPTPPQSPANSPTHSIESHHRLTPEQNYPDPPHAMMCFSSPSSRTGSESSEGDQNYQYSSQTDSAENKSKLPRPFKAYPKDPLSLAYGVVSSDAIISKDSAGAYADFRQKMLSRVQNQNQGTNINKMSTTHQNQTSSSADPTYWEKRRKNNEAAKRSRDARRAKEDEIAIRCAFLEQENLKLRFEMAAMRHEMERMRGVINVPSY